MVVVDDILEHEIGGVCPWDPWDMVDDPILHFVDIGTVVVVANEVVLHMEMVAGETVVGNAVGNYVVVGGVIDNAVVDSRMAGDAVVRMGETVHDVDENLSNSRTLASAERTNYGRRHKRVYHQKFRHDRCHQRVYH